MSLSTSTYRNVDLGTANPCQLLLRVYDAALENLSEAEEAFRSGKPAENRLDKVHQLVAALMGALDFETGEIAQSLLRLYVFVLERVYGSLIDKEDRGLAEARQVLETLRSAWQEMPTEETRMSPETARAAGLSLKG